MQKYHRKFLDSFVVKKHVLWPFEHAYHPVSNFHKSFFLWTSAYFDEFRYAETRYAWARLHGIEIRLGSWDPGPEERVEADPVDLDQGEAFGNVTVDDLCVCF